MSDSAASPQSDAQEPSMEDILASIRRILAEDPAPDEEEAAAPARQPAAPDAELEEMAPVERPTRPAPVESPEEGADPGPLVAEGWDEPEGDELLVSEEPPAPPVPPLGRPSPERRAEPEPEREPGAAVRDMLGDDMRAPPRREDVFVLQPAMRASRHALVSDEPAADSTDVLSQLARAILDRRDIAVSTRNVTLEDMVREMLRPLLHEWLDRNLPYLIERLVKKEIDLMINRAERLED